MSLRQTEKCEECRKSNVKQRCTPSDRNWIAGEKCDRCRERGLPCGPNQKKRRRTTASSQNDNDFQASAPPLTPRSSTTNEQNLFSPTYPASASSGVPPLLLPPQALVTPPATQNASLRSPLYQPSLHIPPSAIVSQQTSQTQTQNLSHHAYLRHLLIIYENVCACQKATTPHHTGSKITQKVSDNLESMAKSVVQEFKHVLHDFVQRASQPNNVKGKEQLLEAKTLIDQVTANCEKKYNVFKISRQILEALIRKYQTEGDEPSVLHYRMLLLDLHKANPMQPDLDTTISTQLAESLRKTSEELVNALEMIDENLAAPLLKFEWLFEASNPFPTLHRALRAGLDKVAEILASDPDSLTDEDFLKRKAFHVATECGNIDFLQAYPPNSEDLSKGRDILRRNAFFETAVNGRLDIFMYLVRRCEDEKLPINELINTRDIDGNTLMDVLAYGGYTEFAQTIIPYGFNVKQAFLGSAPALCIAAERGYGDFCDLLLEHGIDAAYYPPGGGEPPAIRAYKRGLETADASTQEYCFALAMRIADKEQPSHSWELIKRLQAQGS